MSFGGEARAGLGETALHSQRDPSALAVASLSPPVLPRAQFYSGRRMHASSSSDDADAEASRATTAQSVGVPRFGDRELPTYTLEEVAKHNKANDCWIVVHDVVYDMTAHCQSHEGWTNGSKQSTLIAVLSAMGCDCTLDFDDASHSKKAMAQLAAVKIGVLDTPNVNRDRIRYRSWEELVESGAVPPDL